MWTWRKHEDGQASAEYLGVVVIVALIIAALVAVVVLPGDGNISQDLRAAVCRVNLADCDEGGGAVGGDGTAVDVGAPSGSESGSGSDESGQRPGDAAPAEEDTGCDGFFGCAWNGVEQVGSGIYNIGKGAVDDVTGLVELVADPGKLVDAAAYIWDNPGDALTQLVWDDESSQMWGNGDYGGSIGRTIWNVGSWFIPFYDVGKAGSKLGKLGELGRLGKAADKVADLNRLADDAGRLAREAETAAARGDVAGAEKAARQARADADAAEARAREVGCPLAFGLIPRQRPEAGLVLASAGGAGGHLGASLPVLVSPPRAAGPGDCGDATDAAKRADEAAAAAEATVRSATVVTVPTDTVRFSQSSVNGAAALTESMKAKGWVGDPIDVIKMPDGGLTSVDNTRVLAAHQAGIDVQAKVHAYDDPLPPELAQRFTTPKGGVPTTWGEAVRNRIGAQNSGYRSRYPNGSPVTGWNGN